MRHTRYLALLFLLVALSPVAAGEDGTRENLLFLVDNPTEAALGISTGADIAYGDTPLQDEVIGNRTVYEIGADRTPFRTVQPGRIPELVNASANPYCPSDVEKRLYTGIIASLNETAVVCTAGTSAIHSTVGRLKQRYIDRIAASGDDINHLVVSSQAMLPAAAGIAADQHAFLVPVRGGTGSRIRTDGFEDGTVEGWTLHGGEYATLSSEDSDVMAGDAAAVLDAAGTGSKTAVKASRPFSDDVLTPGTTLQSLISFTHEDSHIPKLRYIDSSATTNFFQLRFDPPGGNVWCRVQRGSQRERRNFGNSVATGRVYNVAFILQNNSVQCRLFDAEGRLLASTTIDHPPGFTYNGIDTLEIVSQDETSIDVHFDNITYPYSPATGEDQVAGVTAAIGNASSLLAQHGMYLDGRARYSDGLYLSLLDVPPVTKTDPVEAGDWSLADPGDGTSFSTDLPYADFDSDGRLDAGVGRYPANTSLASRMYLRSKYYEGKDALVASEYLHANWPTILLYIGGGMFTGKSVEHILEDRGFTVSRAVEYRAEPEDFLVDLSPVKLEALLLESGHIEERVGSVLGESVGTAASQVFVAVKALEYIERTLEQYLEFDWSTLGFDADRARERLSSSRAEEVNAVADAAADETAQSGSIRAGVVDALKTEGVQHGLAKIVYAFFWPDRYDRITTDRLVREAGRSDVVYYNGVGNSSAWVLPNNASTVAGIVKAGRYNGTNRFDAADVPENTAGLVFDNADLAGTDDAGMRTAFLRNGAAAYLGTSSVNYAPFSSEIGTRFFRHGYTVGGSLKQAVNRFRRDSITWDPANILARNNVKGKMLRSFRLYGNPEMKKDPEIDDPVFNRSTECSAGTCTLTLTADLNTSVVSTGGNRTLDTDSADSYLLRSFRPAIPLLTAEHVLPARTEIVGHTVTAETRQVENVTAPVIRPLSHGGVQLSNPVPVDEFPPNASSLQIHSGVDNRTRVSLTHAAFTYHSKKDAATVYGRVEAEIRYRPPYEMAVDAADTTGNTTTVTAVVWNNGAARSGDLLLRRRRPGGHATKTVNVTLDPGQNTFNITLPVQGTGERAVDAWLFTDTVTVGPRTDTFTARAASIGVNISVPGTVEQGERFTAAVGVRNRRDDATVQLHVNGSAGVQTVFLQPPATRLRVPRSGRRVWRVPLRAFRPGNAAITATAGAAEDSADFTVTPADEHGGTGFDLSRDGFTSASSEPGKSLQIRSPAGRLRLHRAEPNTSTVLTTGTYTVAEVDAPQRHRFTVRTANGSFQRTTTQGRQVQSSDGVGVETASKLYKQFLREKQKLLERYRLARNRSLQGRD